MIKVKLIHIKMFFYFIKSHFLLRSKWSLISVNTSCSLYGVLVAAEGHQPPKVDVVISSGRGTQ